MSPNFVLLVGGRRVVGWQIVHTETDDPPAGMTTYEIYPLPYCLQWIAERAEERAAWRLLPIFEGDVEEPVFIPDHTAFHAIADLQDPYEPDGAPVPVSLWATPAYGEAMVAARGHTPPTGAALRYRGGIIRGGAVNADGTLR